jgi:hypothetical protein
MCQSRQFALAKVANEKSRPKAALNSNPMIA